MTTETTARNYFAAIHAGGWEDFVADDFTTFASGNFDTAQEGKPAYIEGAGRFFATTSSVEIRDLVIQGDLAAAFVRYQVRSRKGTPGVCDVAERLTFSNGKLTSSAIFFDTQALTWFMSEA